MRAGEKQRSSRARSERRGKLADGPDCPEPPGMTTDY